MSRLPTITITLKHDGDTVAASGWDGRHTEEHRETIAAGEEPHNTAKRAAAGVVSRLWAKFDMLVERGVEVATAAGSGAN